VDYPRIDPVLVHLGPLQDRWYGLMYVIGFILSFLIKVHEIFEKDKGNTRKET
jgi:phosphatidylglycerol---prolipoprotein diacylglyceryl transferase